MASAFAHAVTAMAVGSVLGISPRRWRLLLLGVLCAVLPDLDSIGFWLGIPYEHPLGHRGFSHSIAFAALTSGVILLVAFRDRTAGERRRLGGFVFLATASHGVLDAMTNGGLGVAFFSPLHNDRYFLPFRPIEVSPLEPHLFFTRKGITVLATEWYWVWIPSLSVMLGAHLWRRRGEIAPGSPEAAEERLSPAAVPSAARGETSAPTDVREALDPSRRP